MDITTTLQQLKDCEQKKYQIDQEMFEIRNKLYKSLETVLLETLSGVAWIMDWTVDYEDIFLNMRRSVAPKKFLSVFEDISSFYVFDCRVDLDNDSIRVRGKLHDVINFLSMTGTTIGQTDIHNEIERLKHDLSKAEEIANKFKLEENK